MTSSIRLKGRNFDEIQVEFLYKKMEKYYDRYKEIFIPRENQDIKVYYTNFVKNLWSILNQLDISFIATEKPDNVVEFQFSNCTFIFQTRYKRKWVKKNGITETISEINDVLFRLEIETHWWSVHEWKINSVVDFMNEVNENYPFWINELMEIKTKIDKFHKVKKIAELTIETLIRRKLDTMNAEYIIEKRPTILVLKIKMKYRQMLEISFSYNFSQQRIEELLNLIDIWPNFINQYGSAVKFSGYSNDFQWKKSIKTK